MSDNGNDSDRDNGTGNGTGTGVATRTRTRTKRPSMYRVLLLNDDYTPMEFVVHVLERFFHKNREEATEIMMHVHRKPFPIAGQITDRLLLQNFRTCCLDFNP